MPMFNCCLRKRDYYLPEEQFDNAMQGNFIRNRKLKALHVSSSSSSSAQEEVEKFQEIDSEPPTAITRQSSSATSSLRGVTPHRSSSQPRTITQSRIPKLVTSPRQSSSAVFDEPMPPPLTRTNPSTPRLDDPKSSKHASPAPTASSAAPTIQSSISRLLSSTSQPEMKSKPPSEASSPSCEPETKIPTPQQTRASIATSNARASGRRKPAPLAPPSQHREAKETADVVSNASTTARPKSKAKAKTKAKAKNALRSGNQIVQKAVSASPTGLRTRDHDRMIDMLDPKDQKHFIWASNFLRETIEKDPKEDVQLRESAVIMFLLLFAAKIEASGGINLAASVIAHLSSLAAGDPALATKKAKEAAPKVQFICQYFYRPLVEAIIDGNASDHSPSGWLTELKDNAKFCIGTKPKFLEERVAWVENFMSGEHLGVANCTDFDTYRNLLKANNNVIQSTADVFDTCCKGGDITTIFKS